MSLDQTQNFVRATIASAVDSADSTIDVTDSNQLPDPADGEYNLILWDVSTFPRPGQDPAVEVVRATALDESADTLSVDRGQENTAAADHAETAVLQLSPTAKMFADIDSKTSALSEDGQTFAGESVDVEDLDVTKSLPGELTRYTIDGENVDIDHTTTGDRVIIDLNLGAISTSSDGPGDISLTINNITESDYEYTLRDGGTFNEFSGDPEMLLHSGNSFTAISGSWRITRRRRRPTIGGWGATRGSSLVVGALDDDVPLDSIQITDETDTGEVQGVIDIYEIDEGV